jgi:hypothetical protein
MQTDQEPEPYTRRGVLWLNGITWAVLVLCVLDALRVEGAYAALGPLLFMLPVAGLGAVANFLLALWWCLKRRDRQAQPYLLGCLLLFLFSVSYFLYGIMHFPGKIGG